MTAPFRCPVCDHELVAHDSACTACSWSPGATPRFVPPADFTPQRAPRVMAKPAPPLPPVELRDPPRPSGYCPCCGLSNQHWSGCPLGPAYACPIRTETT